MLNKKKMLSLIALLMLVVLAVGCAKNEEPLNTNEQEVSNTSNTETADNVEQPTDKENEDNKVNLDKKYTITMFQWGPRDIADGDAIINYLDEKFNIDLKVERILAKEYANTLEVRIAAGDIPDIFRYPLANSHIYSNLQQDGYLMNFTEYAEKYNLEGLKEYLSRDGMDEFTEKDGAYQLPSTPGKESMLLIVREDWLAKAGLEKPKTWDEFKNMLQVFKDQKLGGSKTVPLTAAFGKDSIGSMTPAWTGVQGWGKVDGKWMDARIMPEYKDYFKYMASLYQGGLLDREIFTAGEAQTKAKFVAGEVGVMIAYPNRFEAYKKDLLAIDPNAKLGIINPWPTGPAGGKVGVGNDFTQPVVAIKKGRDEDFLARVAALLDYMHSEEGLKVLNFGIEGIHYNIVDGKMQTTAAYERDIIPTLGHLTAMTTDYSQAKGDVDGLLKESNDFAREFGISSPFSVLTYGDKKDLLPIIQKKYDEWTINFLTGNVDIDSTWDQYVEEMKSAGVQELTDLVNSK